MPDQTEQSAQSAQHDPYRLELSPDMQEAMDLALCAVVRDTVQACSDRDEDLKALRMQLEGWSQPTGNLPWPGACQIQDSISREMHTTTTAAMWSAARQTPYVCLEPVNREDVDAASDVETWLSIKAQQFGYDEALYNAIYLANEGRFSVMYCGPRQTIEHTFHPRQSDPNDPDAPDEMVVEETPVADNIEFRTPDPWDFYLYPVTASGPQLKPHGCTLVMERMTLTREDLTLGVLLEGYDREAVRKMLDSGPSSLRTEDRYDDETDRDGIAVGAMESDTENGVWECFQVIGRAPLLPDDNNEPTIPEAMMHRDCFWMCCPALDVVFKQAYSRFPDTARPYAMYHVVHKPNRAHGEGTVSLLSSTDEEMTSIVRFGINNMNLEASPMMSVAESWLSRYSKWTVAPGRFMPRQMSDPIGPKPVTWDVRSQQLIMPWLSWLDAKAGRLVASQSANSALAGRVRKAAEIHFAEEMQQTKFDLFLANIQRGVKETFRILSVLLLQQMDEQQSDGESVNDGMRQVTVTAQQLRARFRFLPQASTDAVSPAQRLARMQTIAAIVQQYWQQSPQYMQLQATGYWYALNHRLLVLAGERSPERFIGPEPDQQPMTPAMAMPMMAGNPAGPSVGGGNGLAFPPLDNGGGMLQASPFTPHPAYAGNGVHE